MYFEYQKDRLQFGGIDIPALHREVAAYLAQNYSYSGAYYLYHAGIFRERASLLSEQLPGRKFFYSVKSLSNISLLKILRENKDFGVDVVSAGEIRRAQIAGFQGSEIVFAGVGKSTEEIRYALAADIRAFHVESLSELRRIAIEAQSMGKIAGIALRLNPDVTVDTHRHITTGKEENKFGLSRHEITEALRFIASSGSLRLRGLQAHIGSQILDTEPYLQTLRFLLQVAEQVISPSGERVEYLSLGGGFGIDYECTLTAESVRQFPVTQLAAAVKEINTSGYEIDFEPGRFISAISGILVCQVEYIKQKSNFEIAILNTGMNDLIRPALYEARHPILPFIKNEAPHKQYDLVGPICESSDLFASRQSMPELREGDMLVIAHSGAYGSVMSSNYNTRPLIPEVLVDGGNFRIIRRPQTYEELLKPEMDVF